ncbi:hypothetical protein ES703_25281 [subsurface metagenome]
MLKPEWVGGNRIAATDGNLAAWQRLWEEASAGFDTDEAYYRVQGLNTDGTRNPDYELMVDIDNLIEYMLLIYYGGNLDAPVSWCCGDDNVNNFYMIYNRNEPDGWKFFAHDAEHTLLVGELYRDRTGPFSCGEEFRQFNPQWLHQQLTAHPEYRMRFADRVHEHFFNAGLLSPEGATDSFMARADEIDLAIIAESARWGDAKSSTPLTKNDDWLPTINNIVNNYFPYRTNIVLNQFKAQGWYPDVEAPTFNQHGGQVPSGFNLLMSAPSGTIYYTLDSNDPRLPGGAINPDASIFEYESSQTPITLTETTNVKARVLDGDEWSALNEATFIIEPLALFINEFMADNETTTEDPNEPGEFPDWLELYNAGTAAGNFIITRKQQAIHHLNLPAIGVKLCY